MDNQTIALAKLFLALHEVEQRIHNEILPLLALTESPDAELVNTLEIADEHIQDHLRAFKLQAVRS